MKIYVPAPYKAERVEAVRVEPFEEHFVCDAGDDRLFYWSDLEGRRWFRDDVRARAAADVATRKRIASLEKQIAKLKGFLGEAGNG